MWLAGWRDIWLLADFAADAQPVRLEIGLETPATGRAPRLTTADDHLDGLSCDRSGQASAVQVRGTVHWLTHRDGPARALSAIGGPVARLPRVLGDTGQVVWVAEADGGDALEIAPAAGPEAAARRIAAGEIGWVARVATSPDGRSVAVASRDGRLLLVDVASGQVTELARSDGGPVSGLAFAPDSAWLAWSQPGREPLSRIRLARVAERTVSDVTDGRFADTDPVFTSDGRYLAFLSRRTFDPVYDAHVFDLAFPYGSRPFLVTLAADTPSPFGPLVGGRPVRTAKADHADTDADGAAEEPAAPVHIDLDGLSDRITQVPVVEARYTSLRAVDGGLAWLIVPLAGELGESGARPEDDRPRPALEYFDIKRAKCTELEDEVDWFEVSGDGARLAVRDRRKLLIVPSNRTADADNPDDKLEVDLTRARFLADPAALWRAAYRQAGRAMRHEFWVADMAEADWDGALDAYRPLLDRIATPDEFADLIHEVVAELGSSHAYVRPAYWKESPGEQVGMLGADLEPGPEG